MNEIASGGVGFRKVAGEFKNQTSVIDRSIKIDKTIRERLKMIAVAINGSQAFKVCGKEFIFEMSGTTIFVVLKQGFKFAPGNRGGVITLKYSMKEICGDCGKKPLENGGINPFSHS